MRTTSRPTVFLGNARMESAVSGLCEVLPGKSTKGSPDSARSTSRPTSTPAILEAPQGSAISILERPASRFLGDRDKAASGASSKTISFFILYLQAHRSKNVPDGELN